MMLHWLVFLFLVSCDVTMSEPVIGTSSGKLNGLTKTMANGLIHQFLGVPYADPPQRFKKPDKLWRPDYEHDATQYGPACPQRSFMIFNEKSMSEDCLTLNIFIPQTLYPEVGRTIMIWLHGGAFTIGYSAHYDGSELALRGDVIVVTINYRLGLLGFFSSGDGTSPGNYGLWDQKMAIEWVKSNANAFGGDPNSIAIFGESAGAKSVTLQSLSLLNKGLFQRAIAQSDYGLQPVTLSRNWGKKASRIGEMLNCFDEDITDCLRGKDVSTILDAQDKLLSHINELEHPIFAMEIGPVKDYDFLMGSPEDLAKEDMFQSIDFMAGFNDGDGGVAAYTLMALQDLYKFNISKGIPTNVFCDVIARAIANQFIPDGIRIADMICERYRVNNDLIGQSRSAMNALTHALFAVYTIRLVKDHAASPHLGNTYLYQFSHVPSFPILLRLSWQQGANHADEIPFAFGLSHFQKYYSTNVTDREKELEAAVMDYFTTFAKTGNPNDNRHPYWPDFREFSDAFMNLNLTLLSGGGLLAEDVAFWDFIQGRNPILTAGAPSKCMEAMLFSVLLFGLRYLIQV